MSYKPSQWSAMKIAQKKIHLMHLQERAGVKFNIPLAESLLVRVDKEMEDIAAEVEPQLPEKTLSDSETKKPPTKQIKLNGEPTAYAFKYFPNLRLDEERGAWVFDHPERGIVCSIPYNEPIVTKCKMTFNNQGDIKNWLIKQGWVPTFWNYKKDDNGKFERDDKGKLIQTSAKIQEAGTICPNLLDMEGELVEPIVRWLSLRNRRSVIKALDDSKETGWLNHPRLLVDERLPASWSQVAKSHRIQHKIVANIPKASPKVVLGKEMRSLFIVDKDKKAVGYDAAGLEARVMAHFTWPYDDGEFAKRLLEGDIHSYTAVNMFPDQVGHFDIYSDDFDPNDKAFKPWRDKAKNVLYASIYGASPAKIARMIGVSQRKGDEVFKKFWEANWALDKLKENLLDHWRKNKKKFIINPLSGAKIPVTKEHTVLNYLFQNTGAFIMDVANHIMDVSLEGPFNDSEFKPYYLHKGHKTTRVIFYHDEDMWETDEIIADDIGKLGVASIEKAGKLLGVRIPLTGEYKIGDSWADVH
jgi:hypothetical protein